MELNSVEPLEPPEEDVELVPPPPPLHPASISARMIPPKAFLIALTLTTPYIVF
jgi:hypothetical protein